MQLHHRDGPTPTRNVSRRGAILGTAGALAGTALAHGLAQPARADDDGDGLAVLPPPKPILGGDVIPPQIHAWELGEPQGFALPFTGRALGEDVQDLGAAIVEPDQIGRHVWSWRSLRPRWYLGARSVQDVHGWCHRIRPPGVGDGDWSRHGPGEGRREAQAVQDLPLQMATRGDQVPATIGQLTHSQTPHGTDAPRQATETLPGTSHPTSSGPLPVSRFRRPGTQPRRCEHWAQPTPATRLRKDPMSSRARCQRLRGVPASDGAAG